MVPMRKEKIIIFGFEQQETNVPKPQIQGTAMPAL
jgi:hypothetical protein